MSLFNYLPAVSALLIITTAILAGPVLSIPGEPTESACSADVFPGNGNASVSVIDLPKTATIEQSRFGAEVWRLKVPNAHVNVTDIEGRPLITYKIILHELRQTTGSSVTLNHCQNTTNLSIMEATFAPNEITRKSYNATLKVIYRGMESGETVETELATKNITVQVKK